MLREILLELSEFAAGQFRCGDQSVLQAFFGSGNKFYLARRWQAKVSRAARLSRYQSDCAFVQKKPSLRLLNWYKANPLLGKADRPNRIRNFVVSWARVWAVRIAMNKDEVGIGF